jgi:hypothetical protein
MAVLLPFFTASAQDIHLPALKTRTVTFKNVTVMKQSKTDIFISHSQGMGNIKIETIDDDDAMRALGFKVETKAEKEAKAFASTNSAVAVALSVTKQKLQSLEAAAPAFSKVQSQLQSFVENPPPQKIQMYAAGVLLVVYLFFSFCLKLICLKTGNDPGFAVWLPILQMVPAFRAAQMSCWWMLGMFVPLVNLVGGVIWCFKIAHARGKGAFVGFLLLLPITNLLAFLYLAFSIGAMDNTEETRRAVRIGTAAAAVAEA